MAHRIVGKPIGRVDGIEKVNGEARYSGDVSVAGLVWGKALRSPLPHARIARIDTSRARAHRGVLAVLTARDLPDILVGRRMFDMPLLARDRVRFTGEKIAVVAAADPDVAEEATALIDVEYEDLPAVIDPEEAILVTRKTFINRPLAWLYSVPYNLSGEWMPYEFRDGDGRSGILTQASMLSMFSHPGRSSPTKSISSRTRALWPSTRTAGSRCGRRTRCLSASRSSCLTRSSCPPRRSGST